MVDRRCVKENLYGCPTADATQARITLARAVYSSAEIILLDDVLAALDVHTWVPLYYLHDLALNQSHQGQMDR